VSLDTRAQGVFNGRPNPVDAGFEFTITATDATVATPVGLSVTMLVRGAPIVGTLAADGSIVTKFSPNDPGGIRGRFSDVGFDAVMEDDFSKSSDTEDVYELRLVRQ
jgi:hypothetical protein